MPGLDGFETTRLIREWLSEKWLPIIFVTGKNEENDLRRGIDAGGDDYLIKPVSETILGAKIRAMERITQMHDQLSQLNKELTELSERDYLTKLYNRRTFETRADEQWRLAARTKEPLSLLIMDIDHFKAFNDYYGHIAGDECIKQVAHTIESCLSRPADLVARYGGEEFIVLLPDTDEHGALHVAERIRRSIESLDIKHRESPTDTKVTISVGGAVAAHTTGTRILDQINAADKALYSAKQAGRNRICVKLFSPRTVVLVAENHPNVVKMIDGKLNGHCLVLQARTRHEALELATKHRPDAMFIDTEFDDNNGQRLAIETRKNLATAQIPLVLLAEHVDPEYTRKGGEIEAFDCHLKPANETLVVQAMNTLLFGD